MSTFSTTKGATALWNEKRWDDKPRISVTQMLDACLDAQWDTSLPKGARVERTPNPHCPAVAVDLPIVTRKGPMHIIQAANRGGPLGGLINDILCEGLERGLRKVYTTGNEWCSEGADNGALSWILIVTINLLFELVKTKAIKHWELHRVWPNMSKDKLELQLWSSRYRILDGRSYNMWSLIILSTSECWNFSCLWNCYYGRLAFLAASGEGMRNNHGFLCPLGLRGIFVGKRPQMPETPENGRYSPGQASWACGQYSRVGYTPEGHMLGE